MSKHLRAEPVVVVGAGPAGLTAALELAKAERQAVVFEADEVVGGISRSVEFQGCRMDIGGHRFFTKVPEIEALWKEILGDDLLIRRRISRIHYRGRFFDYPLRPMNALWGLGFIESTRVLISYLKAQAFPEADESTFDVWVSNRFGRRLFEVFFERYTEKVWGRQCSQISSTWAAQRIKNLDLTAVLKNALLPKSSRGSSVVTSLIDSFYYPRLGPGMMWERCRELVQSLGVDTHLKSRIVKVYCEGTRVRSVDILGPDAKKHRQGCAALISSMPIGSLIAAMDPVAPPEVIEAAEAIRYRDFLIVGLIVGREALFPDNWIYVHSPEVRVGRVQNFGNWSPEMVEGSDRSFVGLEYFASQGDELWAMSDEELVKQGALEAQVLGLFEPDEIEAGTVVRMTAAYPVYDRDYERYMPVLRQWLDRFDNVYPVGRNGQHRYNNQDHSMLTGLLAARNVAGAHHDLWSVNEEQCWHEAATSHQPPRRDSSDQVRQRGVEALLEDAFARYDEVALGGAIGIASSLGLAIATAVMLLSPNTDFVPMLSLLSQYLFGYKVTWSGLFIGMVEMMVLGFIAGWTTARLINALIAAVEKDLHRRLEIMIAIEIMDGGEIE